MGGRIMVQHGLDHNILFTVWKIIAPLSSLVLVTYLGRCTQNGVSLPILCSDRTILEMVRSPYSARQIGTGRECGRWRKA